MKKLIIFPIVVLLAVSLVTLEMNPNVIMRADELDNPIDDEGEEPYTYVNSSKCVLSISLGTATVSSEVIGKSGTTSTSVTVHLEKLVNSSWEPYTSWYHSGGKNQNNSDSTTVTHGVYRVWMSVTAVGADGSESFNVDGNTVGY